MAEETQRIIGKGGYCHEHALGRIDLAIYIKASVRRAYVPDLDEIDNIVASYKPTWHKMPTVFSVCNKTTLRASDPLCDVDDLLPPKKPRRGPLCLVFGSAKHPGGGWLSGSYGQEEFIMRRTGMSALVEKNAALYDDPVHSKAPFYSNYMQFADSMPVFRSNAGGLFPEPYYLSFVVAAAPNLAAARSEAEKTKVRAMMRSRIHALLAVAATRGYHRLVLGAWGCGAFGHKAEDVAEDFRVLMTDGGVFENVFTHVVFGVPPFDDGSNPNIKPFLDHFANGDPTP